ncbi:MAG: hypothetical protein HZC41_17435 [Chloroflexi bacterium]|nr:hypothetical protein [Chloroflexota bacterium]
MSDASIPMPQQFPRPRVNPQRLAWGVLLLSFAIFCFLCLATGLGVYYFLFQSSIPLEVVARVGQGSIGINGQFEASERALQNSVDVSAGGQSQATVFFFDPNQNRRLIATMTVKGSTGFTLRRAIRPRFNWSGNNYEIEVENFTGDVDVFVDRNLERNFRLVINVPPGIRIDLGGSGQYTVSARGSQTRVYNQDGQAVIIPADPNNGRDIPAGSQGIVFAAQPTIVALGPAFVNLLQNSTFQDTIDVPSDSGDLQPVTTVWRCTNQQDSPPRGSYRTERKDGRVVLRFVRADNATSHGETRCLSYFDQNGRDVSSYDFLEVRASFNINYQSLPACGREGSECPLMLQVDYIDQNGRPQTWYHGFYYLPQQEGFPLSCSSCRQEHDRINEKSWYTYESGNLFALLGPSQIPKAILNVQFYASGHQYDVSVGEVSLLAGRLSTAG